MKNIILVLFFCLYVTNSYADGTPAYCNNQLVARPIDNGYTWTLTSHLAQALREAELRYGERDHSWTILGVEFSAGNQPQIWYPYSDKNEKYIIVQLTKKASCDDKEALFQLSHEVIHLLSPIGGEAKSTTFEEGLAAYFSIQFLKKNGFDVTVDYFGTEGYKEAYNAVVALYDAEQDVDSKIEMLRLENPNLSQVTKEQFMQAFINIDESLAERLASPFK